MEAGRIEPSRRFATAKGIIIRRNIFPTQWFFWWVEIENITFILQKCKGKSYNMSHFPCCMWHAATTIWTILYGPYYMIRSIYDMDHIPYHIWYGPYCIVHTLFYRNKVVVNISTPQWWQIVAIWMPLWVTEIHDSTCLWIWNRIKKKLIWS